VRIVSPAGGLAHAPPMDAGTAVFDRRAAAIGSAVLAEKAHLGAWIDGDGETLLLVDEQGRAVEPERLLVAFAKFVLGERQGATIALEGEVAAATASAIERLGGQVVTAGPTRQAMFQRMESSGAVLGGGPSGRVWFCGPPPVADALAALGLLASLLSQSDRPLSEVLDAAAAGG
jgi:phosphomannomutase